MYINFSFACGTAYQGASANAWLNANALVVAGQVNGAATTSDTFRLSGVIVLPGIQAPSAARSPFIMRPYDQELLTCRRYYQQQVAGCQMGSATASAAYGAFLSWNMRSAPTVTFVSSQVAPGNFPTGAGSPVYISSLGCLVYKIAIAAGNSSFIDIYAIDARL
jgi:hypothetical protein